MCKASSYVMLEVNFLVSRLSYMLWVSVQFSLENLNLSWGRTGVFCALESPGNL